MHQSHVAVRHTRSQSSPVRSSPVHDCLLHTLYFSFQERPSMIRNHMFRAGTTLHISCLNITVDHQSHLTPGKLYPGVDHFWRASFSRSQHFLVARSATLRHEEAAVTGPPFCSCSREHWQLFTDRVISSLCSIFIGHFAPISVFGQSTGSANPQSLSGHHLLLLLAGYPRGGLQPPANLAIFWILDST